MRNAEAQAEYDKLKGLLEELSAIGERKDKTLEKAEATLQGVGNADALRNLEINLRGIRRNVLSQLAAITNRFGG